MDKAEFKNVIIKEISEGEEILQGFDKLRSESFYTGDGMAHFGGRSRPSYDRIEKDKLTSKLTMWERRVMTILKDYWGEDEKSPCHEFKVLDPNEWLGDFKKMGMCNMNANITTLRSLLERIDYLPSNNGQKESKLDKVTQEKPYKVFISHSSEDVEFVKELVRVLEFMGVDNSNKLMCSSVDGYRIPISENFPNYIKKQFEVYRLFVIIIHSHNYYASPISLNEMGAAWVLKTDFFSVLTKGFDYSDMRGLIGSSTISAKVDAADAKSRLNELKNKLVPIFKAESVDESRWENIRDEFLERVNQMEISKPRNSNDIFDSCYLPVFDNLFSLIDMADYPNWTYRWAVAGKPRIGVWNFNNLERLKNYLHRVCYYKGYELYNNLLANLNLFLEDYIGLCLIHLQKMGDEDYTIECFYKEIPNNPYYEEQLSEYQEYTYLIADMTFELTRLLNLILERIRDKVPNYLIAQGIFVIGNEPRETVEYKAEEKTDSPYPGLKQFVSIRSQRSFCYSKERTLNFIQ